MEMRSKLHVGITIILAIATIAAGALAVAAYSRVRSLSGALASSQADLSSVNGQLERANTTIAGANDTISTQEAHLATDESEVATLEAENTTLHRDLAVSRSEASSASARLDRLLCDPQYTMDYTSILAASSRLMGYVDGLEDVAYVSGTLRNTLWDNADSKVHVIRYIGSDGNPYSMQFLVYFDEFGWEPSTFYIDGQCWLDAP
jgi:hypothetical protein